MIHEFNLGFIARTRSTLAASACREYSWAAAVLLAFLGAAPSLAVPQQSGQAPQPAPSASAQQPAKEKAQSQKKTFDPYYFPGKPVQRHPVPQGAQSKSTAADKDAGAAKAAKKAPATPSQPGAAQPAKAAGTDSAAHAAPTGAPAAKAPQSTTPSAARQATAPQTAPRPAKAAAPAAPKAPPADVRGKPGPGNDQMRTCLSGDDSPDGTISGGWRKVEWSSPMGTSCHWEKVE